MKRRSDAREKDARTEALKRLVDGAVVTAQKLRDKIIMLLELAEDVTLLTTRAADAHLHGMTPPATTKEIGRQVCCYYYCCMLCMIIINTTMFVQVRILIERHGCVRKQLFCFSSGGKKYAHIVVKELYYDVLRRIESKKVWICMHTYTITHTHKHIHHALMYIHTTPCTHAHTHCTMHTCTCTLHHAHMHIHTTPCTYAHMHIHIHNIIHIRTHTYMHMHMYNICTCTCTTLFTCTCTCTISYTLTQLRLSEPVSIIESVLPKRRGWRGVGRHSCDAEMVERYTLLVMFTAWKWSMSKASTNRSRGRKKTAKRCPTAQYLTHST